MGACLSAPKPAGDGASASSARTFGVTPVKTVSSNDDIGGEMVEVPLDSPPSRASGTTSGFGSFLQAKVSVDPKASDDDTSVQVTDVQNAAPRVTENASRIDQPLVDDMDAAVASVLAGTDTSAPETVDDDSVDLPVDAEADTTLNDEDVSLVLSEDVSEVSSDEDDDEDESHNDEDDESHDVSHTSNVDDEALVTQPSEPSPVEVPVLEESPALESPAPETPQAPTTAAADMRSPGTPDRNGDEDEDDSLSMIDMAPVSDSEADSELEVDEEELEAQVEASAESAPAELEAPSTPEARKMPEASSSDDDDEADDESNVSDATLEKSFDGQEEDATNETVEESVETIEAELGEEDENYNDNEDGDEDKDEKAVEPDEPIDEPANDEHEHADSSDYDSSVYSDEDDAFDTEDVAGPKVESTVEVMSTTVDATVTEVRARSKHSPPPTPRVRGVAELDGGSFSSRGATPRSGLGSHRSTELTDPDSSREGGDSYRSQTLDSYRSQTSDGWQSVLVLYVTSDVSVRKTAGQCQRVRQTLANLGVEFLERDISMATAYKDELNKRMKDTDNAGKDTNGKDNGKDTAHTSNKKSKQPSSKKPPTAPDNCTVPCLFVDDECVGFGEALDEAAKDGSLISLLEDRQKKNTTKSLTDACSACSGQKLVICDKCDGTMRWRMVDPKTTRAMERRCPWCNEVGMQTCTACVSVGGRGTGSRRGR